MPDVLRYIIAPLLAAIIGGLVVHLAARRRDVENERRRQRVDYLVEAYRVLSRTAHRELSSERAEIFENALSDVILLGTDRHIELARKTIASLADRKEAPIDDLLISLRHALRKELQVPDDGLERVPVLRIMPGSQFSQASPLKLQDATEVQFAKVAAQTGVAVALATTTSTTRNARSNETSTTSVDVSELRKLAETEPNAALISAYNRILAALHDLLKVHSSGGRNSNAAALAREAAERGIVTPQLVTTVEGLEVMKDVGLSDRKELSTAQANEYIDLVTAALYVVRVSQTTTNAAASE